MCVDLWTARVSACTSVSVPVVTEMLLTPFAPSDTSLKPGIEYIIKTFQTSGREVIAHRQADAKKNRTGSKTFKG